MLTDIEIAQQTKMTPITEIAASLGIREEELEPYGRFKAKLNDSLYNRLKDRKDGKLILVTAINPTPAGEGKTTTTAGLGEAMAKIGKNAVIALREPSLGPVFGVKGGAAGGGYAQVVPMEDINLHFTGDMHALTSANNLLCAMLDNHMQQGNELRIDQRRVLIKRCLDMNDRALRNVVVGLGGKMNGIPREDGFIITVASEVMAILCLAADSSDLKERLGNILVAYNLDGEPVYAKDLKAEGAMAALLRDAINPNLVQTLEGTPVIMHGGPFANIAHGCNSVRATRLALKLADYCITEAGFGSDLGAEKFFDIKCRLAGLRPNAVVVVATARALKYNGGVPKAETGNENLEALKRGLSIWARISRICASMACPWSWRSTALTRTRMRNLHILSSIARKMARILPSARCLPRAARAAWSWRARCAPPQSSSPISTPFMRAICPCAKRLQPSQRKSTAPMGLPIQPRRRKRSRRLQRSAAMRCRSASPRHSIRFRTTQRCWAARLGSKLPSGTCASPTARASWSLMRGTS